MWCNYLEQMLNLEPERGIVLHQRQVGTYNINDRSHMRK